MHVTDLVYGDKGLGIDLMNKGHQLLVLVL